MVQFTRKTKLDARTANNRVDLAVLVPSDLCDIQFCLRPEFSRDRALGRRTAVCYQSGSQSDVYANSIWLAKPAFSNTGYFGCLGHDRVDDRGRLEPIQMGRPIAGALSGLGFNRLDLATQHNLEQLGPLSLDSSWL